MAMICSPRPFSHLGVTARLPEIQHPLSRLGDPETISVRGVSRDGHRDARLGKVTAGMLPDHRSKSALHIKISPRRDSKGPTLKDVLKMHGVERLDSWKKLDQWVNLDKRQWNEGRTANEDEIHISSRPGTQVNLQTDELIYLIQEKITSGGFYTLKQLFQANDPTGRGHVTRDVLKIILTKFLGKFITEKQFCLLLSRLLLKDKAIITFEKFHLCFRADDVKGYPLWMDPVRRQQAPEKKTAVQVHLYLKEIVRDRPLEFMSFLPEDDYSRISHPEFLHILYQMGIIMEEQESEKLWKRYDKGGVGTVKTETLLKTLGYKYCSENEEQRKSLLTALSKVSNSHPENQIRTPRRGLSSTETERKLILNIERWLKEKLKEGFKDILAEFLHYDQERTGKVTKEEFLKVLQKFHLHMKEDHLNLFLARCGLREPSENVTYTDFLQMFQDRSDKGILQKVISDSNHRFHKTKNKGPKSTISALESGLLNLLHSDFIGLLHAFQAVDTKKMDAISPKDFRNVIEKRCLKMTDEEFECLLQRLPIDNLGNIKYLDFMAGFESM
ncbi:EF-hand calcium-binding domain-containing protein 6-like [Protopterus annectens]|uniref:EF-hand calcium-binding domain-containing protein 6-like n=1 Tax=Protopterus annectens TaxID=7888 RepID=UPI001CFAB9E5|nr:EF-hand calcium-binding domain-containing protein 6-like [Protopterus annectens]